MKNASRTFTYTAQRESYISTVCALLFIMIAEVGLIAYLIARFVSNELIELALIIALVALFLNVSSKLLAPLWTKHQLNTTSLQLHYGLEFKAEVPRNTIIAARQVRERVALPIVRYEAEKGRIVAAFSEQGQVLLVLDQPYPFRVGLFGSSKSANQLLINVDQRDELLAALELQASSVEKPALVAGEQWSLSGNRGERGDAGIGRGDASVPTPPLAPSLPDTFSRRWEGISPGRRQGSPPPTLATPALTWVGTEGGDANIGKGDASVPPPLPATPAPTWVGNLISDSYRNLAIRTESLTRRYKGFIAVDNLNLEVHIGEIYGFLGLNGAGKTTTMKMLVGLLQPDAGHAWISGYDVWEEPMEAKAALGYVADRTMLYDRLTGREFLGFLAQIRGIPEQEATTRIEQLLNMLELKDRGDTACGTYSYGMKRKLVIVGALIHEPPVLIMDEPLNGLDPLSARRLKDLFAELASGGTTIFMSTHDLGTAESICHRVGIIHNGRLLVEGIASELRQVAEAPDLEAVFLSLTAEETQVPV